ELRYGTVLELLFPKEVGNEIVSDSSHRRGGLVPAGRAGAGAPSVRGRVRQGQTGARDGDRHEGRLGEPACDVDGRREDAGRAHQRLDVRARRSERAAAPRLVAEDPEGRRPGDGRWLAIQG